MKSPTIGLGRLVRRVTTRAVRMCAWASHTTLMAPRSSRALCNFSARNRALVRDTTLADLLRDFRSRYFISGEINSTVSDQRAKMDEIKERYSDGRIDELDGVSIDYDDWHFNVRPSNTEPLLRLNLESLVSQEDMERRRDEVLGLIRG